MRIITALACTGITLSALPAAAQDFTLTSTAIAEGVQLPPAQVFQGFGCEGGNTSPQLAWSGAPEGTKSFALTAHDPDAPTDSGWWHWLVANIPATTTELATGISGSLPEGVIELANDYGATGFGGACPPPGEVHRYIFTVHALGVETLDLPAQASNALASYMINGNSIGQARLTAIYKR
ncbi:YbhB/YbcL family Raf kinase inhibitor-like protein [Pseudooceanicola sp. CBS1P-1]|uniref:YbhB/YbcL family Raf kinase inhibitor-like protein n=1 Tax=Pseudooceanicola albus TaxID=2692189 RepID=A0A6L7G2A7_9RHOB|nr:MULTISPECIES: YbhB/YbcL family Raf kinase inhibitor-like protein [Pseudooceanicola]MBT9385214.1 YbhB/YbcL family Raf kinase inhibitor-like protein [Pseudooceanicola endophyticus]MXN18494.1 YbhB/YbcL family Raf kinase inhibitor-like protein [Pseudooceanicola albus]